MSGHPNMPLLSKETDQVSAMRHDPGFCPRIGDICFKAAEVIEEQVFNSHPFNVDLATSACADQCEVELLLADMESEEVTA